MQRITDWLYIGNYADLISEQLKTNTTIDTVLNLAEELELPSKNVSFIDIDDFAP